MGRTTPNDGYSITCPSCRKVVHISATMTGKPAMCPGCRKVIPETDPFAPVVMLEEVPEMTEPIQRRRPTDTIPSREDRTQRRPTTTRLRHREPPIRKSGGMGWLLGALLLILLPVGFGLLVWYLTSRENDTASSYVSGGTAPTSEMEQPKKFTNSVGMQFVWIPPGTYTMGVPDDEPRRLIEETPQHDVEITKGFYFGVYEVTQEEFEKLMGSTPSLFRAQQEKVVGLDTSRFPVERLTWYSAVQFCQTLSDRPEEKQAKRRYRLPTEAEWEYACRGGSKTYSAFHTGNTLAGTQGNVYEAAYDRPVAVDDPNYPANGFGLYHMHGNVYEWCSDRFDANYYSTCLQQGIRRDPPGPTTGNDRVVRGGGWFGEASQARSGSRNHVDPDRGWTDVGFRVICEKVP